ncbi:MAG: haloacid dehalogenase-like hydrolase [Phycisphaerae bacterium]|nr:haloacid dehalogenase-like hydrolase [Phycisphaerae bacterium]
MSRFILPLLSLLALSIGGCTTPRPLASWADSAPRDRIITFVARTTTSGSPDFVPPHERIAVFDNDGTLWAEQPAYAQLFFAIDRIKAMAPRHPAWRDTEPFKSIIAGDIEAALSGGEQSVLQIIAATHSGMTTDEFERHVQDWVATARHPQTGRLFTEMVYLPMIELLAYLREHGFRTYIVSGGGVEFIRPWSQAVYGIPPEQVIGSSVKTRFELRDGTPVLVKLPDLGSLDDKEGKPININLQIGRRPIAAFGNSDGDLAMLQWTAARDGESLCMLIHHNDAGREWAYDRTSPIGKLDRALDEAIRREWMIVSMKDDWTQVFRER